MKNKTPIYILKANANYRLKTKKITLPNELVNKLNENAKNKGMKLSNYISFILDLYNP